MHNYKKLFIFLPIAASLVAAFWPNKNEELKAFEFYKASNYSMALAYAAKSPLLEAYILRESKNFESSNAKFKKALKQTQNANRLFEIELNLAFNAYLADDLPSFHAQMIHLRKLENSHTQLARPLNYFFLFKGLDAFFLGDYECALFYFEKQPELSCFSPWTEHAFQKEFTEAFVAEKIAFSLMANGQLKLALEKVDTMKKQDQNRFYFLKAFYAACLKKESFKVYLDQIEVKEISPRDFAIYFDFAKKHFLESLQQGSWQEFSIWQDFFNKFSSSIDVTAIVTSLKEEADISVLLQNLKDELRVKLLYMISAEIEEAFLAKDFHTLEKNILATSDSRPYIQKVEQLSFELATCKKESIEKCQLFIQFWSKIEKNRENRLQFAKKLVDFSKNAWIFGKSPEKSKELFKMAFLIPDEEDRPLILEVLKEALLKIHHKALSEAQVDHYFYVVEVAKALNLNVIKLYNNQEKNDLLEAAKIFLAKGHYSQAHERVLFLLLLDEENEEANKLMKLIKKVYNPCSM